MGLRGFKVLGDGTFVTAVGSGGKPSNVVHVHASSDEGRSWRQISRIDVPKEYHSCPKAYPNASPGSLGIIHRFPDDGLVCLMNAHTDEHADDWGLISGRATLLSYRSTDAGKTWAGPGVVMNWALGEGGAVETASGKLLLVIRFQRATLPDDPPELFKETGADRINATYPYKHLALADSLDGGRTWQGLRQLTTVFGQCYGYPAALDDGTVVVVHDTRYGPGPDAARAMISRDEGKTWEDEVYYLFYGEGGTSYSQSVVLEDGTIVTVGGGSDRTDGNPGSWDNWLGHTDMTAIRWRPVRP